jgi:hypothetical protein
MFKTKCVFCIYNLFKHLRTYTFAVAMKSEGIFGGREEASFREPRSQPEFSSIPSKPSHINSMTVSLTVDLTVTVTINLAVIHCRICHTPLAPKSFVHRLSIKLVPTLRSLLVCLLSCRRPTIL